MAFTGGREPRATKVYNKPATIQELNSIYYVPVDDEDKDDIEGKNREVRKMYVWLKNSFPPSHELYDPDLDNAPYIPGGDKYIIEEAVRLGYK
ncbi:MAG: hypothetical protein LBM59_04070 [Ruminococcus sp.]|jgi:hypothetical protein|nr:hypothetical protein [Ruminococcus sp.]